MPAGCAIGVDLGGTKLLCGLVSAAGEVLARERRTVRGQSLDGLLETACSAIAAVSPKGSDPSRAMSPKGSDPSRDTPVGIGIPSLIDSRTGVSVRCVHLPLDGVRFGAVMGERLGRPVVVDNDANCAMLAEWRLGAARGASHACLLTLGTGIGGGLVLDGRLYRGAVGAGGELGHMTVDLDGPPCFGDCPNRGCLEAVASGSALARDAAEAVARRPDSSLAAVGELTGEAVTEAANAGDPVARAIIEQLGTKLGAGLAALTMALNPEVIVIGGGVSAAGELLLAPARAELAHRALSPSREVVRVERASFGEDAGMVGAALMALEAA